MRTPIFATAAVGMAAIALFFSSCSGKKSNDSVIIPVNHVEVIPDAPGSPVKANIVADTTLNIGEKNEAFTRVDRIYQADDSANFYMSVSAVVPYGISPVTETVSNLFDSLYASLEGPSMTDAASLINTPGLFASHLDNLGADFVSFVTPMAENTDPDATPGYMLSFNARPVYSSPDIITYEIVTDSYEGGNSADYNEAAISINPANGQVYQLADLVVADSIPAVRQQLVEAIALSNEKSVDEYLAGLTLFNSPQTAYTVDNFPIYNVAYTPGMLTFTYPKYSIAPGSEGSPRYTITPASGVVSLKR